MPPRAQQPHDGRDFSLEELMEEERREALPPEFLIPRILQFMRDHQDDAEVLKRPLHVFQHLIEDERPSVVPIMIEAGVVDEVAQAMNRHSNDEQAVEIACDVLHRFVPMNAYFRVIAEATDGCASFATAMRNFPDNEAIQKSCGLILCFLAQARNVTSTVFTEDGIPIMVHALSVCIESPLFCYTACGCIQLCLKRDESDVVKRQVEEAGGIPLFVDIIKNQENAESAIIYAFKALTLMAVDDELLKSTMVELDVSPHTFVAMNNRISSVAFQSAAFEFLWTLTDDCPDIVSSLHVANGVVVIATVIDIHRDDPGISTDAVLLILHLGLHSPVIMIELAINGLLCTMVDVLSLHASSSAVLHPCTELAHMAEAVVPSQETSLGQFCTELEEHMRSPTSCSTPDCMVALCAVHL